MVSRLRQRPPLADKQQFLKGGCLESIYPGAIQYWRLDRDRWQDTLDRVNALRFTTVSIYLPWEVHEIERAKFDFGTLDRKKDLEAFLTLAEEKGLRTIACPGPRINSELTWFGYPRRILDNPRVPARDAQGGKTAFTQVPRSIPAGSDASNNFLFEASLWFDAVLPILVKHQYPNGGLIAAVVESEITCFFFNNPYACDFSPASIRLFQAFLENKYGTIENVEEIYGQSLTSFSKIDGPRQFEGENLDLPAYADWIEYRKRFVRIEEMTGWRRPVYCYPPRGFLGDAVRFPLIALGNQQSTYHVSAEDSTIPTIAFPGNLALRS
jgi:beta-galactosidase